MIIQVINLDRIIAFKFENHSPITAHGDRPGSFLPAFQLVQFEAWQVHVLSCHGSIQTIEYPGEPCRMAWVNPTPFTITKKDLKSLMLK